MKKPRICYRDKDRARVVSHEEMPYPKEKLNANNLLTKMTARILKDLGITTQDVRAVLKEWHETIEEVTRLNNGYEVAFPYIGRFETIPNKMDLTYMRFMPEWMRRGFKIQKVNAMEWLEILSDPNKAAEFHTFMTKKRQRLTVFDIVKITRDGITAVESLDLAGRIKQAVVDDDPGVQDPDHEGQGFEG